MRALRILGSGFFIFGTRAYLDAVEGVYQISQMVEPVGERQAVERLLREAVHGSLRKMIGRHRRMSVRREGDTIRERSGIMDKLS